MGFFDGYNISTSGMSAQRARMNVVSANIANAQTTHSADGGPYKKQNVVFEELLLETKDTNDASEIENLGIKQNLIGVNVKHIQDAKQEPIMKYEPGHPDADENGYVAYPNINPIIEMVDLMEAQRGYEANLTAFTSQKSIDTKTLEILKA